jgi:proteasome beta subunit
MKINADTPLPLGAPLPGSSFSDLITSLGHAPAVEVSSGGEGKLETPHGTTVLALRYEGGVVMAGDRQATEGYLVAHRYIKKVFSTDHFSAVAIAGTAGLAVEMVRLFQTELEHYEKIEGTRLSLDGKATFLSRLVRNQLPMAFQGLAVVPLFAGFDEIEGVGRVFSFDVVGGRYEENDYGSTGSGSRLAKSYLRGAFQPDGTEEFAVTTAVGALVAAADEDTATGGPDLIRGILPNIVAIDSDGIRDVEEGLIHSAAETALGGVR